MEQFNDLHDQFKRNQDTDTKAEAPKLTPEEIKQQAVNELRTNIAKGIKRILFAVGSLFLEALIVKYLWNYVFDAHQVGYWQSMAFIVLVRLVISGITNKKNN